MKNLFNNPKHFFLESTFKKLCVCIIIPSSFLNAQLDTTKTKDYLKAIESLQKKDSTSAITLFKESIRQNDDAPSYYELAKIYWPQKDFLVRNKAFEYMKMAVMKDEKNIEYKYFYADICKYFARFESVNQWKEIVAIDSTQIKAWINLAEFSSSEFSEWDKSFRNVIAFEYVEGEKIPMLMPLQEYPQNDYLEAVNYYKRALQIDSTNYNLRLSLALFYAKNNKPLLGIPHLKQLERFGKADKFVYQCFGLLYYKAKYLKESYLAYQKALEYMKDIEREDFTLNSVKFILESSNSNLNELSKLEITSYLNSYWRSNDPLLLTDYNERLLEHYSRVAFANLSFSIPSKNIVGWKSNRGEMVLRYGEPLGRMRIRPNLYGGMGGGPDKVKKDGADEIMSKIIKGERWNYKDFTILFEDPQTNGNYQFDNSQLIFIDDLRKSKPTTFYPKFDGPIFDLPYQSYQFASKNKTQTDVFLSYEINFSDSSTTKEKFTEGYNVGLFMSDNNFSKKFENKKTVSLVDQPSDVAVNTLEMSLQPQTGNLAFEMERKKDKGVMAYHGKYNVKSFNGDELKISDVVLASDVETERNLNGAINRNNISVLPNPTKSFSKNDQLFLYYEIYNLTKNTNSTTDFEQKITIQKKEEGGVINSLLSVVGLDKDGKKISLTSKYQTPEKDPQMYLQLDMSKYEQGEYVITVTIKNNVNGKEVSSKTEINWQ